MQQTNRYFIGQVLKIYNTKCKIIQRENNVLLLEVYNNENRRIGFDVALVRTNISGEIIAAKDIYSFFELHLAENKFVELVESKTIEIIFQ